MESHPARGAWIEISGAGRAPYRASGRTPQGVRGLKSDFFHPHRGNGRRTPQGVRGLKYQILRAMGDIAQSHPARGAWIEIPYARRAKNTGACRTPQGVRGLKSQQPAALPGRAASHPARGAWIEILCCSTCLLLSQSRTPQGVRGLKCRSPAHLKWRMESHPARGAWIEMLSAVGSSLRSNVAPRKGCVD